MYLGIKGASVTVSLPLFAPLLTTHPVAVAESAEYFDICHPRQPANSGPGANGAPRTPFRGVPFGQKHTGLSAQRKGTRPELDNFSG